MTQTEKDLLLKDLCARLPYNVKIETLDGPQIFDIRWLSINMCNIANPYLPYLFPLSSMSEELENELLDKRIELKFKVLEGKIDHSVVATFEIDFYHKHHLDYRGFIPMGLAIDATNLNIY